MRAYVLGPGFVWSLAAFVILVIAVSATTALVVRCAGAFFGNRWRDAWPALFLVPFAVIGMLPQHNAIWNDLLEFALDYLPLVAIGMLGVWPIVRGVRRILDRDGPSASLFLSGVFLCVGGALLGTRFADFVVVQTVGRMLQSDIRDVRNGVTAGTPTLQGDVGVWPGTSYRARMVLDGPLLTRDSIVYDEDVAAPDESARIEQLFGRDMAVWKIGPNTFFVAESQDM
jgi:hypothetical protein